MKAAGVSARELDMAKKLIDDMSDAWDPSQYHDTFRDDIMALVDRKIRAGKTEEIAEVQTPHESRQSADILDLSDLLKRSLGRGKGKPAAGGRKRAADDAGDHDAEADDESAAPARKKPRATRATSTPRGRGAAKSASASTARKRHAAA
jgi:DNA end-binding protein Ku